MKRPDLALILATALTQTLGWGTLFTPFALVVQPMEADLGWSRALLNGAFTLGLLVAGALAIPVGRHVDREGGKLPLVGGPLLGAAGLVMWSTATHPAVFYLAWVVIGCAHATALWTPAMAVVVALAREPMRAITLITFLTGFTGTIFIPLNAALVGALGWRDALLVLAALECVAAAVAWWQFSAAPARVATPLPGGGLRAALRRPAFWGLALCFAGHAFIGTAMGAHLVPLLRELDLPEASVILLAALHGPFQVAARIGLFLLGTRASTQVVGVISTWLLPLGLLWLALAPAEFTALLPFVLFWAMADGLLTIVRSAGTAEILGREGYGAVTGALTLVSVGPRVAAPILVALIWEAQGGYGAVPWLLAAIGVLAALAFLYAVMSKEAAS
ncbi:MFS transporter [Sabulicella glaciei]|uniref:MFS transporter n=1 Tax=Sabulicella glaciei TaxID=2984948 RepID=A0ABT3NXR2_9PROT|nr:MFS transporter [Roseococcus sp. MDT2-1-1]MCW8086915.1 MFS transporter [Roseococcus sp. MDT2-1-1]